jgi:transcriptional regulator with XRE-family HTH domain
MKLSAIITEYRKQSNISQREFARRCGLSNSYISFIENDYNPKTGKPIIPTLEQYQKIASGMGLTVHQLFERLDKDSPVDLHVLDAPRVPIVVPNSEQFVKITKAMSVEDYETVMRIFEKTYNKLKEKGEI